MAKIEPLIFNDEVQLFSGRGQLDLNLVPGNIYGIQGENGVGKSSLLQYLKDHSELGKQYSFIDQDPLRTIGNKSLNDLVSLLRKHKQGGSINPDFENLKSDFKFSKLNNPLNELSGGENQMAKILASMVNGFNYGFWDEPTSNLDQRKKQALQKFILKRYKSNPQFMLIIVDHDQSFLSAVADKILVMKKEDDTWTLQ